MRDIVKDAALITVARQYKEAGWDVSDFLDYYNENDVERQRMTNFLEDMHMVEEKSWERALWDDKYMTERFVRYWSWV